MFRQIALTIPVNGQSGVTNGTVNGTTTGSGIPKEIRQEGDVTDEGEEQE